MTPDVPDFAPTEEEKRARREAKQERLTDIQNRSDFETERLYRLFGAASTFSGQSGLAGTRGIFK